MNKSEIRTINVGLSVIITGVLMVGPTMLLGGRGIRALYYIIFWLFAAMCFGIKSGLRSSDYWRAFLRTFCLILAPLVLLAALAAYGIQAMSGWQG